jgi:hypothetical protein
LKTAPSADPDRFVWHALRMHYHAQLRFEATAAGLGLFPNCYVIVVEATAPHPVTVFKLGERALIEGDKLLTLWAERLRVCEAAGAFPPYVEAIVPLDVPDDQPLELEEAA